MSWESDKIKYSESVESEELPSISLTVPDDRLTSLALDSNGMLSTSSSSSYLFLLTPSPQPLFLKLLDPQTASPLDHLLTTSFIPSAR